MDGHENEKPRNDEFQRRLKQLGYLENPLDKFFIGRAHGRMGVLFANLRIAARVGILGGVFLGVVTALGLSLVSRESFPSLLALSKLAAYFCIIFTVFFTLLELAICLAATLLGRVFRRLFTRTEMIALYSGVFAGLVVLLYGTLWWGAQRPEIALLSAGSLAAFAVIAALAVAAALLTRRGVTALLAVLGGADLGARGKGRATKLYFAVLICGVAIFVGFRLATARAEPTGPSQFEKDETDLSVTLVALDGATWEFFEHLESKAALPRLSRLAEEGFVAPLGAPAVHVNPAVWTTVATGVRPAKHGVTAYSGQHIPGLGLYIKKRAGFDLYDALLSTLPAVGLSRRRPLERRSVAYPAIWDVIAGKGELSGVVNWWGTWPADSFHGFLVSDRSYPKLQRARALAREPWFEDEIYPRMLFDRLAKYEPVSAKISEEPFAAAKDIDDFCIKAAADGEGDYERISLLAVYLPGLDIYTNAFYGRHVGGEGLAQSALLAEGAEKYWRYLDSALEQLLSRRSRTEVVVLVADPGMPKGPERRSGARSERGFVIFAGGPVQPGRHERRVRLVDIAPAIGYLLGFPVSSEADGGVPAGLVREDFLRSHPVRTVETFGRLELGGAGEYSLDGVERLRNLGYLQ